MAKREKMLSKVVMIAFMLMIVVGFTVPLFNLGGQDPNVSVAEPRLCQTDSDCYLMCDENPRKVLCSQNLCQQNECEEYSLYPFREDSITFSLIINVFGGKTPLVLRNAGKDLFIGSEGEEVSVFSSGISMNKVLEKFNMGLNPECLFVGTQAYCNDKENELVFNVNGEVVYTLGDYVAQEGDAVEISYSKVVSNIVPVESDNVN
jgi:hypothetical protein